MYVCSDCRHLFLDLADGSARENAIPELLHNLANNLTCKVPMQHICISACERTRICMISAYEYERMRICMSI
jgi:hypothetical protein